MKSARERHGIIHTPCAKIEASAHCASVGVGVSATNENPSRNSTPATLGRDAGRRVGKDTNSASEVAVAVAVAVAPRLPTLGRDAGRRVGKDTNSLFEVAVAVAVAVASFRKPVGKLVREPPCDITAVAPIVTSSGKDIN